MLTVGTPVSAHNGKFVGVVIGVQGAPEGKTAYRVASFSLLPQSYTFAESELEVTPPPKTFAVGQQVTVHGQQGELIEQNADGSFVFRAEIVLPGSGEIGHIRATHRYPHVTPDQLLRWNL
ncbi:MAG: hypothetical protein E5X53_32690 [Mesorhizobium sp.]|uniref:hypothetical protein n=1 Tax=Mesorhizobium sp. TaxID=1871066 RepID=UPI00122BFC3E|nr:hypothetical protein [Mesorhizobium sp.]TIP69428.1 MAG: hypothetical protein E5X55_32285 [Mesorhizobium sp.]TIQ03496.1 MAG: hypothetical protein E5X57_30735 [Mesorhizobium sp.]TIR47727.1 MAG: hypothetical protein E5X53_32690 [Mesorhizobium sp.]TJV94561.1 MAG: hypothetical protein E5X52_28515 [Mesorhizobium sp.]